MEPRAADEELNISQVYPHDSWEDEFWLGQEFTDRDSGVIKESMRLCDASEQFFPSAISRKVLQVGFLLCPFCLRDSRHLLMNLCQAFLQIPAPCGHGGLLGLALIQGMDHSMVASGLSGLHSYWKKLFVFEHTLYSFL